MRSPVFKIIYVLVLLLILATGVNYFLVAKPFQKEPVPPTPITIPSPVQEPNMSFTQKIDDLRKAAQEVFDSGNGKEVRLLLTEGEVNQQVASMLAQSRARGELPMDIKRASVDLQPDNAFTIEIDAVALNINFNIKVISRIGIKAARPSIETVDVQVPLVLSSFKEQIAGMVRQQTEAMLSQLTQTEPVGGGKLEVQFTEIKTGDQELAVTAMLTPG